MLTVKCSTDEATVNDTVMITCKASIFRYSKIWWTFGENAQKRIEENLSNRSNLILSNLVNQYSLSSTIMFDSVTLNDSTSYTCNAVSRFDIEKLEKKNYYLNVESIKNL